jgi:SAM-dependent methyltransferase
MDAREKYRRLSASYDRRVRWSELLRRRIFPQFEIRAGDVVLDVGCGTGLSFPFIEEAIGPSGRLLALEQSPEMLAAARKRVEAAAWTNVSLIEAPAEAADIPMAVDALVFFVTHDIVRSQPALANVFGSARQGARVLVVGSKWAPWWAFPLNLPMWLLARQYVTTFEGFRRPWDRVIRFVPDLEVKQIVLGAVYVARGTTRGG